jgi:hypothetical protein
MSPLRFLLLSLLFAATPALAGDDFHGEADGNTFSYVSWGARWPDGVIRWQYNPSGQPTTLKTDQVLALLQAAMANWNLGCGLRFEYQGLTSASVVNKDGVTAIGWGNANGYSGYTNIWWNGSKQITEGDIVLNASKLTVGSDVQAIVTHEIGHWLGLTHSDQPRSIMFSNPYHSTAYQTLPKGDDYAACALLYGSPGLASYSDQASLPLQANPAYTVSLYVSSSQPSATRPSSSLSVLPASYASSVYFSAYYSNIPVGRSLSLRLVSPDGYPYGEYAMSNKYGGSAYVYLYWDFSTDFGMQRLPGDWQLQLLDQGQLIARQSFTVQSSYAAPVVPALALLATAQGNGSTALSAQTLPAGQSLSSVAWLLDQSSLGSGSSIGSQPGSGAHALRLLANSGNSRYSGTVNGSSSQDDGPDNGLLLDRVSSDVPSSAWFGATASGTRAAFSLDAQLQIAASGSQQVYVAVLVGGSIFFKVPGGWSASAQPLLTANGPGWAAVNLFTREDIRQFPSGLPIYVGYGSSLADLLARQTVAQVYSLP